MSDPLKTQTDVAVDESGRWLFRGEPIINEDVLRYFKSNLRRDEKGYCIHNAFGERKEIAYLSEVRGFPLLATGIEPAAKSLSAAQDENDAGESKRNDRLRVVLETGQETFVARAGLRIFAEDALAVYLDERNIYVRLNAVAMSALADYLEEKEGRYYLNLDADEIPLEISWADMQELRT